MATSSLTDNTKDMLIKSVHQTHGYIERIADHMKDAIDRRDAETASECWKTIDDLLKDLLESYKPLAATGLEDIIVWLAPLAGRTLFLQFKFAELETKLHHLKQ